MRFALDLRLSLSEQRRLQSSRQCDTGQVDPTLLWMIGIGWAKRYKLRGCAGAASTRRQTSKYGVAFKTEEEKPLRNALSSPAPLLLDKQEDDWCVCGRLLSLCSECKPLLLCLQLHAWRHAMPYAASSLPQLNSYFSKLGINTT